MLLANQQPDEGQIFGWGKTLGIPYFVGKKLWEGRLNKSQGVYEAAWSEQGGRRPGVMSLQLCQGLAPCIPLFLP